MNAEESYNEPVSETQETTKDTGSENTVKGPESTKTGETDTSAAQDKKSNEQPYVDKLPASESVADKKDALKSKIDVLLKAAGDAPIMKKKKWAVDADKPVAYLSQFIRKYIKCEPDETLFLYVNQTFVPSPDQLLSNLFECFGSDGKLILHYCKSQAWG